MTAKLLAIKNFFFNPILVKDLRSTARSLRFFLFILGFVFLACIPLLAIAADLNFSRSGAGKELFDAMFIIQAVCIGLAIPAYACTTVSAERQRRTFDLLRITSLKPWEILWGKFVAIMSYILVFIFAFLPLVAICFLYGGADPKWVAMLYLHLLLGVAASAAFCLMLSSASGNSIKTIIVGYMFMVVASIMWYAVANEIMGLGENRRGARVLALFSVESIFIYGTPIMLWALFYLASSSLLKPPSWNKSTSLRIWFTVYMLLAVVLLYLLAGNPGGDEEFELFVILSAGIPSVFAAIGFCGEPSELPPRLKRKVRKVPTILKLFAPGKKSAALFVPLIFMISAGGALFRFLAAASDITERDDAVSLLAGILLFIVFCCALAAAARSVWDSPRSRVITISVIAGLILFPMLILLDYDRHGAFAGALWISPVMALMGQFGREFRIDTGPAVFNSFYLVATIAATYIAIKYQRKRRRLRLAPLSPRPTVPSRPGSGTEPVSPTDTLR